MNNKELKLKMKVWYKDEEWEVSKIFVITNVVEIKKGGKCGNQSGFEYEFVKNKDLKPVLDC